MRLLIATLETQGNRTSDFARCRPGELVMPHIHACADEAVDGGCGCRRSLVGFDSHQGVTTFSVADLALAMDDLAEAVRASLAAAGWLGAIEDPEVAERWVADIAWELMQAGARFAVGEVVERRGPTLQVRARCGDPARRSPQPSIVRPADERLWG